MDSGPDTSSQRPEDRRRSGCPAVPSLPISGGGFPHSEIRGSKLVRSSPRLIAAYHVLHRLRVPRHPPNALLALVRSHSPCPPDPGSISEREPDGMPPIPPHEQTHRRNGPSDRSVTRRIGPERPTSHEIRPSPKGRTHLLFTMSQNRRAGDIPIAKHHRLGARLRPHLDHQGRSGARRDRTDDLLLAKQALSQLSYGPVAGGV